MNEADKEQRRREMEEQRREKEEQQRYEKHVRWQEIRITQFGHVNYLILTFAVGALGFVASLLTGDTGTNPSHCWWWVSLAMFAISIAYGIWCIITRLYDFRKTAKTTRLLMEWNGHDKTGKVATLRCKTKKLGKRSWWLLKWQIGLFAGGSFSLVIALIYDS